MNKRLVVVHNRSSGSAIPSRQLRALCEDAGFSVVKVITLDDKLERKLRPYLKRNSYIAAVGGDGTISAVAQHVADTAAVIAPIPGGTLNHFLPKILASPKISLRRFMTLVMQHRVVSILHWLTTLRSSTTQVLGFILSHSSLAKKPRVSWVSGLPPPMLLFVRLSGIAHTVSLYKTSRLTHHLSLSATVITN